MSQRNAMEAATRLALMGSGIKKFPSGGDVYGVWSHSLKDWHPNRGGNLWKSKHQALQKAKSLHDGFVVKFELVPVAIIEDKK